MIYSPQMLNTFKECPVKYFFSFVKNIRMPQLDNTFLLGKNIHAIAAYYLKGEDISIFSLNEKETEMWNRLKDMPVFNFKTVRTESNITCQIEDFWIGGRLDALVKTPNNEYFILDYKTGEIPVNAKYNFQTIVYLLCCDKLIDKHNKLCFTYISVKNGKTETIELTQELKNEYIELLKESHSQIKKLSEPHIKHTEKCKKCSFQKICI